MGFTQGLGVSSGVRALGSAFRAFHEVRSKRYLLFVEHISYRSVGGDGVQHHRAKISLI